MTDMTIKEIRELTKLTQEAFAAKYEIPVSTLKGWEADPASSRHRNCPDYVRELLRRAVFADYR